MNLGILTIQTFARYCAVSTQTLSCVNLPEKLTLFWSSLNPQQFKTMRTILLLQKENSSVWRNSAVNWYDSLNATQKDILIEAFSDGVLRASDFPGPPPELGELSLILPMGEIDVSLTELGIEMSSEISEISELDLAFEILSML